jgi:flagellar hook assembly protein FlgD
VYPNPAGSTLYVEVKKENDGDVHISLYDISGKLVIDEHKQSRKGVEKISVNTSKLVPGLYSIKVVSGKENYQQTVVIE